MFKTTPRSILLGGNLIRKSVMRVSVDEDGLLTPVRGNLSDEEDFLNRDNHEGEGKVDRPPTGEMKDGHYHMIDALLNRLMSMGAKKGFDGGNGITIPKEAYTGLINHMILAGNKERKAGPEGENSANIMSGFGSPEWRIHRRGEHVDSKSFDPHSTPIRSHPDDDAVVLHDGDNSRTVGHMITGFSKKADHPHEAGDDGDFIDSVFCPFHRHVIPAAKQWNEEAKRHYGTEVGPLDDIKQLRGFSVPDVGLHEISSGQIWNLQRGDIDGVILSNRLPKRYEKAYENLRGTPYVPHKSQAAEFSGGHGGIPMTDAMHTSSVSGSGGWGENKKTAMIKDFLQRAASAENLSDEQRSAAAAILDRGDIPRLAKTHAMMSLFGKTKQKDEEGNVTQHADKAYGLMGGQGVETITGTDEYKDKDFVKLISDLGLTEREFLEATQNVNIDIDKLEHSTAKGTGALYTNWAGLWSALINKLKRDGTPHEEAAALAHSQISTHGALPPGDERRDMVDQSRAVEAMYHNVYGMAPSVTGPSTREPPTASQFLGLAHSPNSEMLQSRNIELDARGAQVEPTPLNNPAPLMTSFDTYIPDINQIQKSFETLQIMSAMKDNGVMKHVKKGYSSNSHNDIRSFGMSLGMTTSDIHGILATKGDWNVVAKQWNVSPLIVKATKVTFGGV